MKQPQEILSKRYKDKISEFEGIATEVSYLDDGTLTVKLEALTKDEGDRRIEWFGLHRLGSVDNNAKRTGF